MDYELTEETLEEGRVALYQLERQLKERSSKNVNDGGSVTSSKANSSAQERRLLDQMSRGERLNNRQESLGLTIEVQTITYTYLLIIFSISRLDSSIFRLKYWNLGTG